MRRAMVVAAALALAACKLEYEGAPCSSPGDGTRCPTGQRCGNDLRCSARAAACADFCLPTGDDASTPRRCGSATGPIEKCTGADPVCGAWEKLADCGASLVCTGGASPACVCAAPGTELRVDPTAPTEASLEPNGADLPAACRFKRLGDALAAASAWVGAHPAPETLTVRALGAPATGSPVSFSAETFPLVVPERTTLTTSATTPTPADWIISAPASTALDLVQVEGGGTLEGFTVQTAAATGSGIATRCPADGTAPPTIRDVVVSGGGALAHGIAVAGTCGAVLQRVEVSGATTAALDVAAPSAGPVVGVTRGSFHDSGVGIRVSGGTVELHAEAGTATESRDNLGAGIAIQGAVPASVALNDARVAANGGVGVGVSSSAVVGLGADGAQITGNGAGGIALAGTGSVTASLTNALVTADAGGHGIFVGGGGTAGVTVSGGQVSGNAQSGIVVSGDGAVTLDLANGVQVSGNGAGGLLITAGAGGVTATVSGGSVSGNTGAGITVAGAGAVGLTLSNTVVASNTPGAGLRAVGTGKLDLALVAVQISSNGGTGIVVGAVPTSSSFTMTGCDVFSNATTAPNTYGVSSRNAGGLLFQTPGPLAPFQMQDNRVYANPPTSGSYAAADQIAFDSAATVAWGLTTGSCADPKPNAIGCLRASAYSVSVVGPSTGSPSTVAAGATIWPGADPRVGGFVSTTPPDACGIWQAPLPACP